jgi:hypothetical protein
MQREPVGPEIIRVPGGKPAAIAIAIMGLLGTCGAIIGSTIPDPSEPHKALVVAKLVLLSAAVIGGGVALYAVGRRRQHRSTT